MCAKLSFGIKKELFYEQQKFNNIFYDTYKYLLGVYYTNGVFGSI